MADSKGMSEREPSLVMSVVNRGKCLELEPFSQKWGLGGRWHPDTAETRHSTHAYICPFLYLLGSSAQMETRVEESKEIEKVTTVPMPTQSLRVRGN